MGLQYRKRTKGKNAWFNFSASKKRGVGTSFSLKLGKNITCNSRGRVTLNLGNGLRYVAYKKKKKQPKPVVNKTSNYNYKGIISKPMTSEERHKLTIKPNVVQNTRYNHEYEVCKSCLITLSESSSIPLIEDKRMFAKLARSLDVVKENEVRNIGALIAVVDQLRKMEVLVQDPEAKNFTNMIRLKLQEHQDRVSRNIASKDTKFFTWPVILLIIAACFIIQTCSK